MASSLAAPWKPSRDPSAPARPVEESAPLRAGRVTEVLMHSPLQSQSHVLWLNGFEHWTTERQMLGAQFTILSH